MLSGRRLDLLDPSPLDVEIEDIAHGLSRVARWNGQTSGANTFSVAEHSLLVEQLMRNAAPKLALRWRLAALLHDAPEYVIGDLISPFKAMVGGDYKALENRLLAAVFWITSRRAAKCRTCDQESGPSRGVVRGDATGRVQRGRSETAFHAASPQDRRDRYLETVVTGKSETSFPRPFRRIIGAG